MVDDPTNHSTRSDPTALTTEAIGREFSVIQRELEALRQSVRDDLAARLSTRERELKTQKELLEEKIGGVEDSLQIKIDAMQAATALRLNLINNIPSQIQEALDHHEELQLERLKSIDQRFNERDIRTEQASGTSAQALAAALQAAKELVGAQGEASAAAAVKSETSFTKQIDQIGALIQTGNAASDARITELKERIDRGEGSYIGVREAKGDIRNKATDDRSSNTLVLTVVGTFFIAISLGLGIAAMFIGK